jgi:hypothetical protein
MAKIGPAVGEPIVQPPTREEVRAVWGRTIGGNASEAALNHLDKALRAYLGRYAVQSNMANAVKTRGILESVRGHAKAMLRVLYVQSAEARAALDRLSLRMQTNDASILAFVLQLHEAARHQADELRDVPEGREGNAAFEALIHQLDEICRHEGVSLALPFEWAETWNEETQKDDYSAGYNSPYARFLDELLDPIRAAGLPKSRGALIKAAERARQKDVRFLDFL